MHGKEACDVVLFTHGHLLRAFVKRWLKYPLEFGLSMMLEPGGVGVCRSVFLWKPLSSPEDHHEIRVMYIILQPC